jgi:hypothetical protein
MSESSRFVGPGVREAEELWNVSLFPLPQGLTSELTPSRLENVDERRSLERFHRPLRVSLASSGGNLG